METHIANVGIESPAGSATAVPDVAESLVAASIQAALAAIEIYNKPVFAYREQAFTILLINAWETLCKAKLIADAKGDVQVLYLKKPDGAFKTGRSGNFLTVELTSALNRLTVSPTVCANLFSLIEIRDTATHLYADAAVQQMVHSLGVAALQNYHRLLTSWFGNRLKDCKFQIMPLAFTYQFRSLAVLALGQNSEDVARLLKLVLEHQSAASEDAEFHFVCEIATELRSAKKLDEMGGAVATPATPAPGYPVVVKTQSLVDKYPLSYKELTEQVRAERGAAKPAQIQRIIRDCKIKDNTAFATYNFRTKAQRQAYEQHKTMPAAVAVIYNADAVRFIVSKLDEEPTLNFGQGTVQ